MEESVLKNDIRKKLVPIAIKPPAVRISEPILSASVPKTGDKMKMINGAVIMSNPDMDGDSFRAFSK